jgi:hypothetical protein
LFLLLFLFLFLSLFLVSWCDWFSLRLIWYISLQNHKFSLNSNSNSIFHPLSPNPFDHGLNHHRDAPYHDFLVIFIVISQLSKSSRMMFLNIQNDPGHCSNRRTIAKIM